MSVCSLASTCGCKSGVPGGGALLGAAGYLPAAASMRPTTAARRDVVSPAHKHKRNQSVVHTDSHTEIEIERERECVCVCVPVCLPPFLPPHTHTVSIERRLELLHGRLQPLLKVRRWRDVRGDAEGCCACSDAGQHSTELLLNSCGNTALLLLLCAGGLCRRLCSGLWFGGKGWLWGRLWLGEGCRLCCNDGLAGHLW